MTTTDLRPPLKSGLIRPTSEVRIAVVLYGGVSLAIYINGVTQELLRLVRATAPAAPLEGGAGDPLVPEAELTPLDRVYRELGRRVGSADPLAAELNDELHDRVRTRFVVDVLSGTSAGGINGVFLAKALANVQTMKGLRDLWLEEGDLGRLLNDRATITHPARGTRPRGMPTSVLNSKRMYYLLLDALNGLEREQVLSGRPAPPVTPLVDELDLFVTATDLAGLTLPIPLADGTVFERRHRNVFRFLYASKAASGAERNDFRATRNPFLAFAARCTSSFPVAFEPMQLADIVGIEGGPAGEAEFRASLRDWQDYFRDYLVAPGVGQDAADAFSRRSFGDGGYLDNKPFSHATAALRKRRADRRVHRVLFYVEPGPDHPEDDEAAAGRPDAFANLGAAMSLPRAETIREDVERVLERNAMLDRIERAIEYVDADFGMLKLPVVADDPDFADTDLSEMVARYGASYGVYHRLRVAETTGDLGDLFARLSGFDEDSATAVAIRYLVAAWRDREYVRDRPGDGPAAGGGTRPATENEFLLDLDFSFRIRRLRFLQGRLDAVIGVAEREARRDADERSAANSETRDAAVRDPERLAARRTARRLLAEQRSSDARADRATARAILRHGGMTDGDIEKVLEPRHREDLVRCCLELKAAISHVQVFLRAEGRSLRSRSEKSPLRDQVRKLGFTLAELKWLLDAPDDAERRQRANELMHPPLPVAAGEAPEAARHADRLPVTRYRTALAIFDSLRGRLKGIRENANRMFDEKVKAPDLPPASDPATGELPADAVEACVRRALRGLFGRAVAFDIVLLPLLFGTDGGEAARVDIVRVSPEDASTLVAERTGEHRIRRVYKLAGTRFGNFGAFFERRWRASDMLWGRLDGAERILRSMLAARNAQEQEVLDGLVLRAQAAIVCEETAKLDDREARRLLMQCAMRTATSKAEPGLLDGMMERLLPHLEVLDPGTAQKLSPLLLRAEYLRLYAESRDLEPSQGAPLFARAAQILGRVMDGVSERYGPLSSKVGAWLLWIGRIAWGLVEVALPRTWSALLFRYWLSLFHLLGLLGIASGILLDWPVMRTLGVRLLLVTLGLELLRSIARAFLARRLRLQRVAVAAAVFVFFVGLATLALKLPMVEHWADRQFTTLMDCLSPWLGWFRTLGAWLCPAC
jgi:patatin-related protein